MDNSNSNSNSNNNIQAAIEAGITIGCLNIDTQRGHNGVPYAIVHKNASFQLLSELQQAEDARAERPHRLSGTAQILTEQSMVDHMLRFKDAYSVLFGTDKMVAAVYDYHKPVRADRTRDEQAQWGHHRAEYTPRLSREWDKWVNGCNKLLTQTEFADFLDENDQNIAPPIEGRAVPTQADLATIGHTLKVTSEDAIEATIDRVTGNYQMSAKHNMQATGECKIPKEFDVSIPIFEGGVKVRICCKFRLQKSGGQIKFGWVIPGAVRILREEYAAVACRIAEKTGVPLIFGAPEK